MLLWMLYVIFLWFIARQFIRKHHGGTVKTMAVLGSGAFLNWQRAPSWGHMQD
jgi:hypothetical protein